MRDLELADLRKEYEAKLAEKEEVEAMIDGFHAQFNDFLAIHERLKKRTKFLEDLLQ